MSVVSTVILTCWLDEETDDDGATPAVARLNAWLAERQMGHGLTPLGEHFGGYKAPQMLVYGGAFNYLNHDDFLAAVRDARWVAPEDVQVFICGEEDTSFTEYRPTLTRSEA